jgi:hypothetical protein
MKPQSTQKDCVRFSLFASLSVEPFRFWDWSTGVTECWSNESQVTGCRLRVPL